MVAQSLTFWGILYKQGTAGIERAQEPDPDVSYSLYFFNVCQICDSREKGRSGERQGEKHGCDRNMDQLPLACSLTKDQTFNPGMCPTRNQTGDLLVGRMTPNQLSHTGQGSCFFIFYGQGVSYIN